MAELKLKNLNKFYDKNNHVVKDFNLTVKDKEFIVLVGPSGCGKSTTLRMIAGLEDISEGDLYIDEKRMNDVSPKNRDIAMVFQNYALYPHMNVYDNMAFSLKQRKFPKHEIKSRVLEAANILGIENYLKRKPKALSGGQRQRVALGRAIVRNPKVFLMDEPLSNLDAKLRVQMRAEIVKLHRRLNTTTIFVTHDQTEAMTMATRLVIMKDGLIQQVGTPKEVYDEPENIFVGSFLGSPAMNFFTGQIQGNQFVIGKSVIPIPDSKLALLKQQDYLEKEVVLGIRPEYIHYILDSESKNQQAPIRLEVEVSELTGAETVVYSTFENQKVIVRLDAHHVISPSDAIDVIFDMNKAHFFNIETEKRIY